MAAKARNCCRPSDTSLAKRESAAAALAPCYKEHGYVMLSGFEVHEHTKAQGNSRAYCQLCNHILAFTRHT